MISRASLSGTSTRVSTPMQNDFRSLSETRIGVAGGHGIHLLSSRVLGPFAVETDESTFRHPPSGPKQAVLQDALGSEFPAIVFLYVLR